MYRSLVLSWGTFPSPRFSTHSFVGCKMCFLLHAERRSIRPMVSAERSRGFCDWSAGLRQAGQTVSVLVCSKESACGAIRGLASTLYERKRNKQVLFGVVSMQPEENVGQKQTEVTGMVKWFALLKSHLSLVYCTKAVDFIHADCFSWAGRSYLSIAHALDLSL